MIPGATAAADTAHTGKVFENHERFLKYEETGPNFKPVILLKIVPESFTLNHITSIFTSGSGLRGAWLKSIDEFQWVRHQSGGGRKALLAEVSAPDNDPSLALLPPRISLPRVGEIIVGCTRHVCGICNRMGHKSSVHSHFRIRRSDFNKPAQLDEFMLQTPAVKAVLQDPLLELLEHGARKEAWKCEACKRKGAGYFSALNHINKATSHQTQLHLHKQRCPIS